MRRPIRQQELEQKRRDWNTHITSWQASRLEPRRRVSGDKLPLTHRLETANLKLLDDDMPPGCSACSQVNNCRIENAHAPP